MSHRPTRLLIFISHPIQYFAPLFREMTKRADIELMVLYRSRAGVERYFDPGFGREIAWDIPLLDGYRHLFLTAEGGGNWPGWSAISEVRRFDPDVVMLHGYATAWDLIVLGLARLTGRRILMRGDSRLMPYHYRSKPKKLFKQMIFRLVDGCVAIGSDNRKYYEWLGVPAERIFFAPFSVDNAGFDLGDARGAARLEQRRQWSVGADAQVILFASKLLTRKRADDLLFAADRAAAARPGTVLVIAGTGPEEERVRDIAAKLAIPTIFAGFKNQSEMPQLLAASDLFVLPSDNEPWGLIVNEAMAAGVPVLVSDDVGAAPDLVQGKGTGAVFPTGNIDALAESLEALLGSPAQLGHMADRCRAVVGGWGLAQTADGIIGAARAVVGRHG